MKVCGIYRITHRATGRHYIGQSVDIDSRFRDHRNGKGSRKVGNALHRYGVAAFDFRVVLRCNREELNAREAFCVRIFRSQHPTGFNLIGGGYQPGTFTAEARENFRMAGRERMMNATGCAQLAAARRARWMRPQARAKQAAVAKAVAERLRKEGRLQGHRGVQSTAARQAKAERLRQLNRDPVFQARCQAARARYWADSEKRHQTGVRLTESRRKVRGQE